MPKTSWIGSRSNDGQDCLGIHGARKGRHGMGKPETAAQRLVSLLEPGNPDMVPEQLHKLLDKLKGAIGADFSTAGVKEAKTLRCVFAAASADLHRYSAFSAPFDDAMGADVERILGECRVGGEDGERWKTAYGSLQQRMSSAVGKLRSRKPELADAYKDLKDYCGRCCSMLADQGGRAEFEFYLSVDDALHSMKGRTNVGGVAQCLGKAGVETGGEERQEWLGWYLRVVREKHRQDMSLEKEQEKCRDCGEMKGKGEACPRCAVAARALEEAQAAERKGDWKTAEAKAGAVLSIWKGDKEAERIRKAAEEALEKERAAAEKVRDTEKAIDSALKRNPPDIETAEKKLEEGRTLAGFREGEWRGKIDGAKRRTVETAIERALAKSPPDVAEAESKLEEGKRLPGFKSEEWREKIAAAQRKAVEEAISSALAKSPPDIAAAERELDAGRSLPGFKTEDWRGKIEGARKMTAFEKALLEARWPDAEGMLAELVRLKAGTREGLKGQIDRARQGHQAMLERNCGSHLEAAEKALSAWDGMGEGGTDEMLARAKTALAEAKKARETLERKYARATGLPGITRRIGAAEKRLAAAEAVQAVRALRPATEVKAQGSSDGVPQVTVTWKTEAGEGAATGWRVVRREKGKSETTVLAPCVSGTQFRDAGGGLQLGVWYEYGVTPVLGTRAGPEKVQRWTRPEEAAGCTAKLAPGALSGKGEGEEGGWASVTLEWTLPAGLARGCKNMELTLQRTGGGSTVPDESVADRAGRWEDVRNVSVGREYEYTLQLKLFGKPMGTSRIRLAVKKLQPPPGVTDLELGRSATGGLAVQWNWPAGVESCIWGTAAREPKRLSDLPSTRCYRLRRPPNGRSVVAVPDAGDGEQWVAVFGVRGKDDHTMASPPSVLCISKTELDYHVEGSGLFGRRKPQLVVVSSTGAFPEVEIRTGALEDVFSREGRVLGNPQWTEAERQADGKWKKCCPLDGVRKREYVRLFLVHPERDNCDMASVPPDKCEVR